MTPRPFLPPAFLSFWSLGCSQCQHEGQVGGRRARPSEDPGKLPRVFGRKAREAVWNLESGGILQGPIQRAPGAHDLSRISSLLRMFPELTSRDSITVAT